MIKLIITIVLSICCFIVPLSQNDNVYADTPIISNIKALSGVPNEQNPFTQISDIYISSHWDWSKYYNLNDKTSYVFNGVEFTGADDFTFNTTAYSLVVWFSNAMPNMFSYFVWVQNGAYASMSSTNTWSYFYDNAGNVLVGTANSDIFKPVFDSDGNYLVKDYESNTFVLYEFSIPNNCYRFEINILEDTTTPLVPFFGLSYSVLLDYNTAFNQGYSNGYDKGYDDGVVYANNTINPTSASYQAGYNQGVEESSNLYELFSSAVGAPVQVLMDTFDFEILGVNVSTFILSLLTLGFIVIVVKLLI